jgi:hypothetical protein
MKISIVNKFIAVGLVMLAVGATCSSASPVLPRAFGGDYGRMVQKRLSDIEQITNAPFYPTTEDRVHRGLRIGSCERRIERVDGFHSQTGKDR